MICKPREHREHSIYVCLRVRACACVSTHGHGEAHLHSEAPASLQVHQCSRVRTCILVETCRSSTCCMSTHRAHRARIRAACAHNVRPAAAVTRPLAQTHGHELVQPTYAAHSPIQVTQRPAPTQHPQHTCVAASHTHLCARKGGVAEGRLHLFFVLQGLRHSAPQDIKGGHRVSGCSTRPQDIEGGHRVSGCSTRPQDIKGGHRVSGCSTWPQDIKGGHRVSGCSTQPQLCSSHPPPKPKPVTPSQNMSTPSRDPQSSPPAKKQSLQQRSHHVQAHLLELQLESLGLPHGQLLVPGVGQLLRKLVQVHSLQGAGFTARASHLLTLYILLGHLSAPARVPVGGPTDTDSARKYVRQCGTSFVSEQVAVRQARPLRAWFEAMCKSHRGTLADKIPKCMHVHAYAHARPRKRCVCFSNRESE